MDSLETELTRRRTGLAKWGWVQKVADRIARQSGIVSPDGTIEIDRRTGGTTIRRRPETRQTEITYPAFWVEPRNGGFYCHGGRVYFGASYLDIPAQFVGFGTGIYVAILITLELTGTVTVEDFTQEYTWGTDIQLDSTAIYPYKLKLMTGSQMQACDYPHVGGPVKGSMVIPIAWIEGDAVTAFWWSANNITVTLNHGWYTFESE